MEFSFFVHDDFGMTFAGNLLDDADGGIIVLGHGLMAIDEEDRYSGGMDELPKHVCPSLQSDVDFRFEDAIDSIDQKAENFILRSIDKSGRKLEVGFKIFSREVFLGGQPVVEDILRRGVDGDEESVDAVLLLLGAIELP